MLPLCLLTSQFVVLIMLMLNAIQNKFQVSFKRSMVSTFVYACVIVGLVTYSITQHIKPPSD